MDMRPSSNRTVQLSALAIAINNLDADLLDSFSFKFFRVMVHENFEDITDFRKLVLTTVEEIISDECLALERRISRGSIVTSGNDTAG